MKTSNVVGNNCDENKLCAEIPTTRRPRISRLVDHVSSDPAIISLKDKDTGLHGGQKVTVTDLSKPEDA